MKTFYVLKVCYIFSLCAMVLANLPAMASSLRETALSYVAGGKIVQEKEKEVKVLTPNGTVVEVEFTRNGNFEEASGDSVGKDVFDPGQGLLSLNEAVKALKEEGKSPTGDWSLEKSFLKGWHYDFEGFEAGKAMDYVIDAKTGKMLDARIDD